MAEEDPEEIWRAVLETLRTSIRNSKIIAKDISTISFSAQMHGVIIIDQKGKPLTQLFIWSDRRAEIQTEKLKKIIDPYEVYRRTGCPLLSIYPLVKIMWIKEKMPAKFHRCYKILSAKDYVLYKLLGEPYLDHSQASGTQLLNMHKLDWDDQLLDAIDIDYDMLPTLVTETEIIGESTRETARWTGLRKGTPIIAGASDGALSNLGLGAVGKNIAAINIGTSGAMRLTVDKPFIDTHQDARFFCYYTALQKWLVGGAISNAGIILRWFRDTFGQEEIDAAKKLGVDPYQLILESAGTVKPSTEGLFMLPFFSGERFPIRDPKARGVLFGLTLSHRKAHIARTILESIVYTLRWVMETLEEHGLTINEIRSGGGGARSSIWRQIQADIFGKPVVHTQVEEASALGAAMLGTISQGIYKDLHDASDNMVKIAGLHKPNQAYHKKYLKIYSMYKELYQVTTKFYEELSRM
jgi:gluconokinase